MKIHILYKIKKGPWGGANQFLKALCCRLKSKGVQVTNIEDSDCILLNLNPSPDLAEYYLTIYKTKKKYPKKLVIARIDGPVFLARGRDLDIDKSFFLFSEFFADGIIYQSNWSQQNCYKLGQLEEDNKKVIINAPSEELFNNFNKRIYDNSVKCRLVASSWSGNLNKGFDCYKWLDENLDFNQYEMTFIGNCPCEFDNIRIVEPLPSRVLAEELKRHDIYITASKVECCSNSVIEAIHCGLPVVAPNTSSYPEIVGGSGRLYDNFESIPSLLLNIQDNYTIFSEATTLPSINEITDQYHEFMSSIWNKVKFGTYTPKIPTKKQMKQVIKLIKPVKKRISILFRLKSKFKRVFWSGE